MPGLAPGFFVLGPASQNRRSVSERSIFGELIAKYDHENAGFFSPYTTLSLSF
jgi:hypothetical protein